MRKKDYPGNLVQRAINTPNLSIVRHTDSRCIIIGPTAGRIRRRSLVIATILATHKLMIEGRFETAAKEFKKIMWAYPTMTSDLKYMVG